MPPSSPGRSGFTIRTAARLSHNKQGFPMTVSLLSATVSLGRRQPVHDQFGKLALRHGSRLHHLRIGRHHAATPVLILVSAQTVTVISKTGYHLIASHTIDPDRNYWRNQQKHPG